MPESKQDFLTNEFDHHFTIDGRPFYLPGIQMGDLIIAGSLGKIEDPEKQVETFREFVISRVRTDEPRWILWLTGRSVSKAIRSLGPRQLTRLFNAWSSPSKDDSGEASGSQVSASATDAN